jgi:hypothetical protein
MQYHVKQRLHRVDMVQSETRTMFRDNIHSHIKFHSVLVSGMGEEKCR